MDAGPSVSKLLTVLSDLPIDEAEREHFRACLLRLQDLIDAQAKALERELEEDEVIAALGKRWWQR